MRIREETNLEEELTRSFQHWDSRREEGSNEPFYDDAVSMNLIRSHIIYWKHEIEKKYGGDVNQYPEIYFREIPPEAEHGLIVRAAEIRDKAAEVLDLYLADNNFLYLLYNRELLDKEEAESIHIDHVLGYAGGLAEALKSDDLITMRRHAFRPEIYIRDFAECAGKVKHILGEKRTEKPEPTGEGQMTLFQMGLDMGRCR